MDSLVKLLFLAVSVWSSARRALPDQVKSSYLVYSEPQQAVCSPLTNFCLCSDINFCDISFFFVYNKDMMVEAKACLGFVLCLKTAKVEKDRKLRHGLHQSHL